jgi:nitrate reductase gamma subunit
MIIRSDGCTILILHRCCYHAPYWSYIGVVVMHLIDVTSVLLSWKNDYEVAWQKSSSSFLLCFLHIVSSRRLWWYIIMCHKGLYLCVTCHKSFLQDFWCSFCFVMDCPSFKRLLSCIFKCVLNFVGLWILNFLLSFAFLSVL